MSDELDKRRAARERQACDADVARPARPVVPKPEDPCVTPDPRPERFVEPDRPSAPAPDSRRLVGSIVVGNARAEALCLSGQIPETGGGTGVVALNELADRVNPADVQGLTRGELLRLEPLLAQIQQFVDDNLPALDDGALSAQDFDDGLFGITSMESPALSGMRRALLDARRDLTAAAEALAEQRRRCVWPSREMWLVCDPTADDGFRRDYTEPSAGSIFAHGQAGLADSADGQEQADDRAETVLQGQLECLFPNTEQVVTCADLNASWAAALGTAVEWNDVSYTDLESLSDAGFEARQVDEPELRRPLVWSVTVAAGTLRATTPAKADELALARATEQLDCFWPSPTMTFDCLDLDDGQNAFVTRRDAMLSDNTWASAIDTADEARDALFREMAGGLHTAAVTPPTNTVFDGGGRDTTRALIVEVPAGIYVSDTSQNQATALAETYATTLLHCRWISPARSCSCDPVPVALNDTVVFDADASDTGAVIEAGVFEDRNFPSPTIDDEDPWTSLDLLCDSRLTCVYCNRDIPATCVGAINETSGLPPGTICRSSPQEVDVTSTTLANIPPDTTESGENCLYSNSEISLSCRDSVHHGQIVTLDSGEHVLLDSGETVVMTSIVEDGNPDREYLTPDTADNRVTASAGMFVAGSPEQAQALAWAFVTGSLNCAYRAVAWERCEYRHDLRERMLDRTLNIDTGDLLRDQTHPLASQLNESVPDPPGGWPSVAPGSTSGSFQYLGQRAVFIWPDSLPPPTSYSNFAGMTPDDLQNEPLPADNGINGQPIAAGEPTVFSPLAVGYGESPVDYATALQLARADALSRLECVYTNWPRAGMRCPGSWRYPVAGGSAGQTPLASVRGSSTGQANETAESQVLMSADCHTQDSLFGLAASAAGGASLTGAAASVSGDCFDCQESDDQTVSGFLWGEPASASATPPTLAAGSHWFWALLICADDGQGGQSLQLFVWPENVNNGDPPPSLNDIESEGYYPSKRLKHWQGEYPEGKVFYVGAIHMGSQTTPTGTSIGFSRVYQSLSGILETSCAEGVGQHRAYDVRYDSASSSYKVKVRPGWVIGYDPADGADPVLQYHESRRNGAPHSDDPGADVELQDGDMLALRVSTDNRDQIRVEAPTEGAPEVPLVDLVAVPETDASVHYQPVNPGEVDTAENPGGTEGVYLYKLATLDIDPVDPEKVKVVSYHDGGPITHRPNLWRGINLPGDAEFFKRRDRVNDVYEFRSPRGPYGIDLTQTSQTVDFRFDGESVGMGGLDVVSNLIDQFGPAYIRKIRGADSILSDDTQVQVELDSEVAAGEGDEKRALKVRGNGNGTQAAKAEVEVAGKTVAQFVDGLAVMAATISGDSVKLEFIGVTGSLTNTATQEFRNTPDASPFLTLWIMHGLVYTAEPAEWAALPAVPPTHQIYSAYPVTGP